jgi:hypothetical protein
VNIFHPHSPTTFTEDFGVLSQVSSKPNGITQLNTVDFSPDLVYKYLRNLNVKTSIGPDSLSALLFENLACLLSSPLSLIFSKLIVLSAVPDIWKV